MVDASTVAVAKAVEQRIRGELDSESFEHEFTLERGYAAWDLQLNQTDDLELHEVDKLRVDVVAHATQQTVDHSARSVVRRRLPIDIAVRRKFGSDGQDQDSGEIAIERIDELMLLVEQLEDLFIASRLEGFPAAVWDGEGGGTTIVAAPIREHLRGLRQFTAIIRVVFNVTKKLQINTA